MNDSKRRYRADCFVSWLETWLCADERILASNEWIAVPTQFCPVTVVDCLSSQSKVKGSVGTRKSLVLHTGSSGKIASVARRVELVAFIRSIRARRPEVSNTHDDSTHLITHASLFCWSASTRMCAPQH